MALFTLPGRPLAARLALASALVCCALAGGCSPLPKAPDVLPLANPRMSPDSVAFDIFFIRLPANDRQTENALWNAVDEQRFDVELRRRWHANGMRAGLIAGTIPPALERCMKLGEKQTSVAGEPQSVALLEEPRVRQRHLQIRRGQRSEIVASDILETLPVLLAEGQDVHGRTFNRAQCMFQMECDERDNGSVGLVLLPQIQHGDPQQKWTASDGAFRLDSGRPRLDFDDLRLAVDLTPGQMLVIGSLLDRGGSLGSSFLTSGAQRKLIVVRLSQTGDGELFEPAGEALATDVAEELFDEDPEREIAATAVVEDEGHGEDTVRQAP